MRRKASKRPRARVSKEVREAFGAPTARKFKLPKNKRGTGRQSLRKDGQGFFDGGSSYVAVLTQADLIGPTEVSYYAKRVGDIARRWLAKSPGNSVIVELVTLFAKQSLDANSPDDVVIGPRYMVPSDDDIPDVGEDWEYRNMFRSPPTYAVDYARHSTRKLLERAASKTGMQDNDLDFLGTFVLAIRVRKWTRS